MPSNLIGILGKWIRGTDTVQGARKALPSSEGASRRRVQSGHVGHQSAQQKRRPVCSTQATTGCDWALAFNVAEMQTIFVSRTIHLGHQRRIEVTDGCPVGARSLPNRGGQSDSLRRRPVSLLARSHRTRPTRPMRDQSHRSEWPASAAIGSFEYCWREAIKASGARWDQPGRRPAKNFLA
jgi:hypothetical protein